eukprot:3665816-Pleurochrysis_carterae.AAC.2
MAAVGDGAGLLPHSAEGCSAAADQARCCSRYRAQFRRSGLHKSMSLFSGRCGQVSVSRGAS